MQIGIADKNTLDAVKTKVDNYLDASVNSRATQVTVNAINTNVGSNSDGASVSGSVHAKIKSARTAIDAIKTKTDSYLDATVSTRATQTTLNTVNTTLNTVNTNVGSNANAASATGSVHAKLKDIKNNMQGKAGFGNRGVFETSLSTLQTALNVTGRGVLRDLVGFIKTNGETETVRVTVDGNILLWGKNDIDNTWSPVSSIVMGLEQNGSNVIFVHPEVSTFSALNVSFKSSLKIEISASGSTAKIGWFYEIE